MHKPRAKELSSEGKKWKFTNLNENTYGRILLMEIIKCEEKFWWYLL